MSAAVPKVHDTSSALNDASSRECLHVLLPLVAQGDHNAFAQLCATTSPRFLGLITRVVGSHERAEDVLQEVYFEIWNHAGRYDSSYGKALSWMLTIAHRRAVDSVRSEVSFRERNERYGRFFTVVEPDPAYEVTEAITRQQNVELVRSYMQQLAPKQVQAIELAFFEGLSYPEIADRLSVSLPTIKSRIRTGLGRLRLCFGTRVGDV